MESFWQGCSKLQKILVICGVVLSLLVFALVARYWLVTSAARAAYRAVFLTNGQVYFGKITHQGFRTVGLRDVFYFQIKNTPTSSAATDDISLIKLGNELHGPEDALEIGWQNILFIETLRPDSRVVGAIQKYRDN